MRFTVTTNDTARAAYIEPQRVDPPKEPLRSLRVHEQVVLDLDADGGLVGIEVLDEPVGPLRMKRWKVKR